MTEVPKIYVGPSPEAPQDQPQPYMSATAPYYKLKITYNLQAANQFNFESPNAYGDMSMINIVGNNKPFGGQIVETKETQDGYEYNGLDYTRLLFGKRSYHNSTNNTISNIIKTLLNQTGLPTNGIMNTTKLWPKLSASATKLYDICKQLAGLEGLEFHVNQDGIPILREKPKPTKGYILFTEQAASDYSIDYDDNEIIDVISVYGHKNELLYKYIDEKMVVKYGWLGDIITDSNLTDESHAALQGDALFEKDRETRYAGSITIPDILDIGEGEWFILVPPKWSKEKINHFYTKQVDIDIDPTRCETTIQFLDGEPAPPDEWIYSDPTSGEQAPSLGIQSGDYIYTYRPVWITSDNIYGPGVDRNHINTIIAGLQRLGIKCHDGGVGPNTHDSVMGGAASNALIVEIYGGADAGVIYEKSTSWWKAKLGNKKDCIVFMETASRITGLSFLPRAHDDNYDPGSFSGIAHPDKFLTSRGIQFIEGVDPSNLQATINFIQQQAVLTKTASAPKLPPELAGVPTNLTQPCKIFAWIKSEVHWIFYNDSKQSIQETLRTHKANCDDQAILAQVWLEALGYKVKKILLYVTAADCEESGGHYHLLVWINDQWLVWDTVCHKLTQIHGC